MKFYSDLAKGIKPYVAGEQPRDKKYIKLNTNENPYPPSPKIYDLLKSSDFDDLKLYPDPEALLLKKAIAKVNNVDTDCIFAGNGSDEVLSMCFAAFFNKNDSVALADITYSFYEVYANYFGLKVLSIPLKDYKIDYKDYIDKKCKGIIIVNPNAPTGSVLKKSEVECVVKSNRDKVVIIDQAYIAFCNETCIDLIKKYDNLVVVETLSKSHSLAGIRCGYAVADRNLIKALERIKNSINSYTINRLSMKIAAEAILDREYTEKIIQKIISTRERAHNELISMGIKVIKSSSNFIFIQTNNAKNVYLALKKEGVLVRYFDKKGIKDFIRVTIGTDSDMDIFLKKFKLIIEKNP